jgi:hypothetical protein
MTTRSRYFQPPASPKPPGQWLRVDTPRGPREVRVVAPFEVYERCYHGEWFDVIWDGSVWSSEENYAAH